MGNLKLKAFSRPVCEQNGDAYLFIEDGDNLLMGVIDGLGHGSKAHVASTIAKEYVEDHAGEDLEGIIWGCHRKIKETRGAVLGLARIDLSSRKLQYAGVGDIEACMLNCEHKRPVSRPGIVGHNLRKVFTYTCDLPEGFVFFMHSDGVSRKFEPHKYPLKKEPEKAIQQIVKEWGRETDDLTFIMALEDTGD
ncbi:MAG: SpoIIE family protein phosphatase [Thermoproteota archaeon]